MKAPRWFEEELRLLDPDFSASFDPKSKRWIILKKIRTIHGDKFKPEIAVSKGKEYTPLDRRVLNEIKELICEKNKLKHMDQHLENMEEDDEEMYVEAQKEYQDGKRQFLKKLYGFMFVKMFT